MNPTLFFESLAIAFGMFSALPLPQVNGTKENMRYALAFLPAVGLAQGLCTALWLTVCYFLPLPGLVPAAGLCLIPLAVTGGFHMEGFVRTCHALTLPGDAPRRQELLRDSHVGAGGILYTGMYFVAYFALCSGVEINVKNGFLLAFAYILERAYAGGCAASLPLAAGSGLAGLFLEPEDKQAVHKVCTIIVYAAAVLLVLTGFIRGSLMVLAQMALMEGYKRLAARRFGGLTGALQGWFIQTGELTMLAALVLGSAVEALL